jgi:hypothetical protein
MNDDESKVETRNDMNSCCMLIVYICIYVFNTSDTSSVTLKLLVGFNYLNGFHFRCFINEHIIANELEKIYTRTKSY